MSGIRNRLERLADTISGLPDQDKLKAKKARLAGTRELAQSHLSALARSRFQAAALREVSDSPRLLTEVESGAVRTTRQRSRAMVPLISADEINEPKLNESLEALKRSRTSFSGEVSQEWRSICAAIRESVGPLIDIAERIDPEAARRLRTLLQLFPEASIPETPEDVKRVRAAKSDLSSELKKLPISGKVGTFLRAAITGNGNLRDVLDADVQGFLDAHPTLWTSLRVTLA
jgi:hypothetical protein